MKIKCLDSIDIKSVDSNICANKHLENYPEKSNITFTGW